MIFILLLLSQYVASKSNQPPNIVFIVADDLGWNDVGFHGSDISTPNIDQLAEEGVILENYYVQSMCTPTRGALLTGRYPIHIGLQHYVIAGSQPYGLPLSETTLAQHLKTLNYDTFAVGKWHLAFFKPAHLPENRGFDHHYGYYAGVGDYFRHTSDDGGYFGYDFHRDGETEWNVTWKYSTELFTEEADRIIRSHNQTKPLFLYLAHQAPHPGNNPIQVPQKYSLRFPHIKDEKRRLYAGVMSALDDSVGQIYKTLQATGMADNTVLVFTADNGASANGIEGNAGSNWPFRFVVYNFKQYILSQVTS